MFGGYRLTYIYKNVKEYNIFQNIQIIKNILNIFLKKTKFIYI